MQRDQGAHAWANKHTKSRGDGPDPEIIYVCKKSWPPASAAITFYAATVPSDSGAYSRSSPATLWD